MNLHLSVHSRIGTLTEQNVFYFERSLFHALSVKQNMEIDIFYCAKRTYFVLYIQATFRFQIVAYWVIINVHFLKTSKIFPGKISMLEREGELHSISRKFSLHIAYIFKMALDFSLNI